MTKEAPNVVRDNVCVGRCVLHDQTTLVKPHRRAAVFRDRHQILEPVVNTKKQKQQTCCGQTCMLAPMWLESTFDKHPQVGFVENGKQLHGGCNGWMFGFGILGDVLPGNVLERFVRCIMQGYERLLRKKWFVAVYHHAGRCFPVKIDLKRPFFIVVKDRDVPPFPRRHDTRRVCPGRRFVKVKRKSVKRRLGTAKERVVVTPFPRVFIVGNDQRRKIRCFGVAVLRLLSVVRTRNSLD